MPGVRVIHTHAATDRDSLCFDCSLLTLFEKISFHMADFEWKWFGLLLCRVRKWIMKGKRDGFFLFTKWLKDLAFRLGFDNSSGLANTTVPEQKVSLSSGLSIISPFTRLLALVYCLAISCLFASTTRLAHQSIFHLCWPEKSPPEKGKNIHPPPKLGKRPKRVLLNWIEVTGQSLSRTTIGSLWHRGGSSAFQIRPIAVFNA